jgi:hypothetical protein
VPADAGGPPQPFSVALGPVRLHFAFAQKQSKLPMPYTTEDLSVFDCLKDRSCLQGTNYFEFHAGKRPSDHDCWMDGSLFIRDAGFDFLAELFYQTVPGFDYFAFVEVEPQSHRCGRSGPR